jgi:CHAT domain-containing protein
LRQAKLTLLREYRLQDEQLVRGPGAVRPIDPARLQAGSPQPPSDRERKTLPPAYWAAFVLSGDWR